MKMMGKAKAPKIPKPVVKFFTLSSRRKYIQTGFLARETGADFLIVDDEGFLMRYVDLKEPANAD